MLFAETENLAKIADSDLAMSDEAQYHSEKCEEKRMRKGTWKEVEDGIIELKEDTDSGGSRPVKLGPVGCAFAILCILAVIVASLHFTGVFDAISFETNAKKAGNKIEIQILAKTDAAEDSQYDDGYVTAFEINVKNNSKLFVQSISGELVIYNVANKVLDSSICNFNCYIDKNEESKLVLHLDRHSSNEAIELYSAQLNELSATFRIIQITFEGYKTQEYTSEPVTILHLGVESGGQSSIEQSYQEAVDLFNQGKHAEAMVKFQSLNGYRDSYDKINELYGIAETNAAATAAKGDYSDAYRYLATFGYTADNSDIYTAYRYAAEGNFTEAIRYGLTNVVLPEGITRIDEGMFTYCTTLTDIILPSSVVTIGDKAFYGCSGLTNITFLGRVTSIGAEAFAYCSSLTGVALSESVTYVGDEAFAACDNVTAVAIRNSHVELGKSVFRSCSSLTSVSLPEGIAAIPEGTFAYCRGLKSVAIPESVTTIGTQAFYGTGLEAVALGGNITAIGYEAFCECVQLTEVTLSNRLQNIGDKAFSDCSALTRIVYQGYIEEWQGVNKGYSWNARTAQPTIYCIDGEVVKKHMEDQYIYY